VFTLFVRTVAEVGLSMKKTDSDLNLVLFSLVPFLRLVKMLRHFEQFHLLLRAFEVTLEAMPALLYAQSMIVLLFGSLIYVIEPRENIPTLTTSFWFTLISMTTVGYGDYVPETALGHVCASVLVICGTLYMALPVGIVGNAFSEVWAERDKLLVMKRARDRLDQGGFAAQDIPALFAMFDTGKTGELSLPEFSNMIKSMNVVLDDERLLKLFNVIDGDGGGSIDDQEFVRCLFPKQYMEIYGRSQSVHASSDNVHHAEGMGSSSNGHGLAA
jgi:hypothetical protein